MKKMDSVNSDNQQIYTKEEIKTMKENGLFINPHEFKTDKQIKRELALEGTLPPLFEDKRSLPNLNDYLGAAKKRADIMKEISPIHEGVVHIVLPNTSTLNIISDIHLGDSHVIIDRVQQELEVIQNTPDSYILFTGDLVNGIFWGGAGGGEQSLNLSEQGGILRSMFSTLKGKVLAGIPGEHDSKWIRKTGSDPYDMLEEMSGAPYIRGIAEISLDVGEQSYKIVAQHKARGQSMYNKNHPTYRESRFDLQGADIYISAHTHRKQISQETIREFGKSRMVTHVSTGPYKTGDEYGDTEGFVHQTPLEMFGASLRLHADRMLVETQYDILEAAKIWK